MKTKEEIREQNTALIHSILLMTLCDPVATKAWIEAHRERLAEFGLVIEVNEN